MERRNESGDTVEIDIPERLMKDIKKFIQDSPELGFKSIEQFVETALLYFLRRVKTLPPARAKRIKR